MASSGSRAGSAASGGSGRASPPRNSDDEWRGSGTATLLPLHRGRGKRRAGGIEAQPPSRSSSQRLADSQLPPLPPGGGGSSTHLAGGSTQYQQFEGLGPLDSPTARGGGGSGGGGGELGGHGCLRGCAASFRSCLAHEPLLVLTVAGVVAGIALGAALKPADLGHEAIDLIAFPGEIMLRLLKMLVLPLVSVSMVAGVVSLRQANPNANADGQGGEGGANGGGGSGGGGGGGGGGQCNVRRLARLTAAFYAGSTLLAIVVGILLVVAVHPGRGAPFDHIATAASGGCHSREAAAVARHTNSTAQQQRGSTLEALLNVARQVVPDNVVGAAVQMNVLGLITFSLMFGLALSSLGPPADGLIHTIGVLNAAVQRMVTAALWMSPLGIGSLIAASILRACDLLGTLAALGLWVATVLAGLALFAAAILPLLLWALTGRSPLAVTRAFAQPLLMAFGTSSSAAALPLAMQAAKETMGCDEATVNFFLPLGCTVNMNGTALYEATTAIFIAQAHGVRLNLAELLVIALTASLAAVGAPAIPSAGLVTMLIVLQAVSLDQYASDLAVILAIDWLLDRVRTAVNLLGDAFGVVIVDDLMRKGSGTAAVPSNAKSIPYIQLQDAQEGWRNGGQGPGQQQQQMGAAGGPPAELLPHAAPGGSLTLHHLTHHQPPPS